MIRLVILCTLSVFLAVSGTSGDVVPNSAPLEPTPFVRLPLGSVRARGWLLGQLQLQKSGLTGSAESLYDALTPNSGWLGGTGEGWEKGPYYVRGLIALGYTLDDAELKQRAQKWVDWMLRSQKPDGSFGPASNDDWWPRMVVLFLLRDYFEATSDARVVPFFENYFRYQLATLPARPLRDWGRSRAGDNLDVVLWTYNRTENAKLLDLAKLLYEQAYPWTSIFTDNRFYSPEFDFHPHHIVNVNQAMKMPAVSWQFTHHPADRDALAAGLANLNRQYGRIDGQISGTEMLSGLHSTDGVELCADIERIISDGIAINILGDASLADQMEKIAFNSMPAHVTPTMQQMTYYQLSNQVTCQIEPHGFTQDYPNSIVPSPYSGFPCCCYNWHTGWPQFVSQMWSATSDGGLAAIAYGPSQVTGAAGGTDVTITEETDYPFGETIKLKVDPEAAAAFPLVLRVPAWCDSPSIAVNNEPIAGVKSGTFHRIQRTWKAGDVVQLSFPMKARTSTWVNQSIGLERGPLVFGLKIKEQWEKTKTHAGPFPEYEVRPQSPWNYALNIDPASPAVKVRTNAVSAVPFDPAAPPVVLSLSARRLSSWGNRTLTGTVTFGRSEGSWHAMSDAAVVVQPDVPHRLRIEAAGASIKVFIDDLKTPRIEKTDDHFTTGSVGLRAFNCNARFNDVTLDGQLIDQFDKADASGWQTYGGDWSLQDSGYATTPSKDSKAIYQGQRNLKDCVLEATITASQGGDAGLMFRVSDPSDRLDGYHGYYVGLTTRAGKSGDAAEPPQSPVVSSEPEETIELIPMGSARLRVNLFPVLRRE